MEHVRISTFHSFPHLCSLDHKDPNHFILVLHDINTAAFIFNFLQKSFKLFFLSIWFLQLALHISDVFFRNETLAKFYLHQILDLRSLHIQTGCICQPLLLLLLINLICVLFVHFQCIFMIVILTVGCENTS